MANISKRGFVMAKKYIKCPRCELNYILEGEDYCHVCKSEMKHHTEADDELIDLEDMELCPMCGQNYIKEDQTMCDECRGRSTSKSDDDLKDWKDDEEADEDESLEVESSNEMDDDFNSGFSDIDPDEDDDPYETGDDLMDDAPIEFAMDEDEIEEDDIVSETMKDDFETVEALGDDEDDDDEDDDDDYDFEGDMLGKKK